jgi:hypothetical protein
MKEATEWVDTNGQSATADELDEKLADRSLANCMVIAQTKNHLTKSCRLQRGLSCSWVQYILLEGRSGMIDDLLYK